jgi:hypothetical protein
MAQLDTLRTTGHLRFTEEAWKTLNEAGSEILANANAEQYQKNVQSFVSPRVRFLCLLPVSRKALTMVRNVRPRRAVG